MDSAAEAGDLEEEVVGEVGEGKEIGPGEEVGGGLETVGLFEDAFKGDLGNATGERGRAEFGHEAAGLENGAAVANGDEFAVEVGDLMQVLEGARGALNPRNVIRGRNSGREDPAGVSNDGP